MTTKRERIIEMYRNKPEGYVINDLSAAVGCYITCVREGLYVPVEGEDEESPKTAQELWDCYMESLNPPQTEETPPTP